MQLTQQLNVVITGVSTGIGFDAARYLIERGYRVFGSVRKHADAERVKAALGSAFMPLIFDVTDSAAVAAAVEKVQEATGDQGLCALVNNSGISDTCPLINMSMAEVRQMFEVNVFGLLSVTQAFLPLLGARSDCPHPPGRIVNISSISGGLVFPLVSCYGATKHAVEALFTLRPRVLAALTSVVKVTEVLPASSNRSTAARLVFIRVAISALVRDCFFNNRFNCRLKACFKGRASTLPRMSCFFRKSRKSPPR